jgi:hypothetical protein
LKRNPSGTNNAVVIYYGDRPSFPPSPRAWPVILGAADMPIGCALTFCLIAAVVVVPSSRAGAGCSADQKSE